MNIKRIKEKNEDKIFKLKNVVGVGIGKKIVNNKETDQQCIRVYVSKKKPIKELSKKDLVPKNIFDIETDVIEIGEIKALSYKEYMRPAKCGISIGHFRVSAGTLGCLVKDKTTQKILILSNNHVLAQNNKAKSGDNILQPGPYDGGSDSTLIGNLLRFIEIKTKKWWAYLAFWIKEPKNKVDCAVAIPIDEKEVLPEILEIGVPKGIASVKIGTPLQKTGRTTGYTKGIVIDDDVTVSVNYGDFIAKFEHQVMADAMSAGGDSGSLVLDENKKAIGLLFAGSDKTTIINPINEVLKLLDVNLIVSQ